MRTNLEKEDIKYISESIINWSAFKNKTIVISGGTGFIGSYICDVFRYRNEKYCDNVKIISLTRHGGVSDNTVEYVSCDITQKIELECNVDFIIHLASNTHPKQYLEDPVGTITTNILGCKNLLEISKKNKKSRFLLASSVEIYGQCIPEPVDEMYCGYINCNDARNGYNESKRLCESLCQSYKKQFSIDFVTARLSRIIGPDRKKDTKAISQFMDKAIKHEDIILKSKGNQLFSYCYISDAVYAILFLITNGINGEAYNIAADIDNMTLGDYAKYISDFSGVNIIYDIESDDSVSKASYALLNNGKIKGIGWFPQYSIKQGLKRMYQIKNGE